MKFSKLYKHVGAIAAASVAVWLLSKHEPIRSAKRRSYYLKRSKYHPKDTYWWREYVLGASFDDPITNQYMEKTFRRLFGVPRCIFLNLVERSKNESWFGQYAYTDPHGFPVDVTGNIYGVPLELKILGSLKVLAKGCSFHDLHDNTEGWNHEEVMRVFFYKFVHILVSKLYDETVHLPRDRAELDKVLDVYKLLGFPGCAYSMDCVHIKWKNCPFRFRHLYYSHKNNCRAISYNVTCTHSGFIQTVSNGFYATDNDSTIVRFDGEILPLLNNPLFTQNTYDIYINSTNTVTLKGVYGLTDNGYFQHPLFIFPTKGYSPFKNVTRWSRRIESVRKDIETVFGRLKIRFQILNKPILVQSREKIDTIVRCCCVLHNMILQYDKLDKRLNDASNWLKETTTTDTSQFHLNDCHADVDDDVVPTDNLTIGTENVIPPTVPIHFVDPMNPQLVLCKSPQKAKEWAKLSGKLTKHFEIAQEKGEVWWPKCHRGT